MCAYRINDMTLNFSKKQVIYHEKIKYIFFNNYLLFTDSSGIPNIVIRNLFILKHLRTALKMVIFSNTWKVAQIVAILAVFITIDLETGGRA